MNNDLLPKALTFIGFLGVFFGIIAFFVGLFFDGGRHPETAIGGLFGVFGGIQCFCISVIVQAALIYIEKNKPKEQA